jgi:hypothetical protein
MILRAMLAVADATGSASHARQVKGDDADKEGYPGTRGWGLGVRLKTPYHKKNNITKPQGDEGGWISQQRHETTHESLQ